MKGEAACLVVTLGNIIPRKRYSLGAKKMTPLDHIAPPTWRTAIVSGTWSGLVVGAVSGTLSPLMGAVFDVAPTSIILHITVGLALWTCGFGMLVGLTSGAFAALAIRILWRVPAREMLIPLISLVLAVSMARLFATDTVRATTAAPWPAQTLFGSGNAFCVASLASLYAGLLVARRQYLTIACTGVREPGGFETESHSRVPGDA